MLNKAGARRRAWFERRLVVFTTAGPFLPKVLPEDPFPKGTPGIWLRYGKFNDNPNEYTDAILLSILVLEEPNNFVSIV
jgi:hypothetical protein